MLNDYFAYTQAFLKIRTKADGITPFYLRNYQKRFIHLLEDIRGPKRVIVLKPRQAGFSTLCASYCFHRMVTRPGYTGLAMADKGLRTQEIRKIYSTFLNQLPDQYRPQVLKDNTEEMFFDDQSGRIGLKSGILYETGQDPNAGRSSPRLFAHLSEVAFYMYYLDIDDGVQNSVPLHNDSLIIKESTANGKAGVGRNFHLLWQAAKRRESIYKPFFVAWYEIDDYEIDMKIDLTSYEKDLLSRYPGMTVQNLAWRRLKLSEFLNDEDNQMMSPEERFKQDFPCDDNEAFISTGSPVYPYEAVDFLCKRLESQRMPNLKDKLNLTSPIIKQFWEQLKIFTPPRHGLTYFIGADVAEGLAIGDSSSAFIVDQNYNQVASWHGKIEPDLYGHLLAALGDLYCNAMLIVENNNMGHTTVTTLKNMGYTNIYKSKIEDKIARTTSTKLGWVTTAVSKQDMLNESISILRQRSVRINDLRLAQELGDVSRNENGSVELNGKDRVVAFCLALMGIKHYKPHYSITNKLSKELYDLGPRPSTDDFYS